ncbi:hypothetical protein ACP4OV_021312 [Aristida adscensionis]
MAAAGAALRLRLLYRMLRVGELLALVAVLSWSSSRVPAAAAAVLRLAGSLLLNARFVFVLGNAIVLLLLALSRHDLSSSSSSEQQPAAAAGSAAATPAPQAAPAAAAAAAGASDGGSGSFPSFAAPAAPPPAVEAAASFATPATPPPAMETVPAPAPEPVRYAVPTVFEDVPAAAVARVKKARAPQRSRSEKMSQRVARRAVSPELRRSESENGRRRRSSVTARDAAACWAAMDDTDELRRRVEAFIAKQTRFHREESMTGAVAVVVE